MTAETHPIRACLWGLAGPARAEVSAALEALGIEAMEGSSAEILVGDAAKLASGELDFAAFDHVVAVVGSLPAVVAGAHVVIDAPVTRQGVAGALAAVDSVLPDVGALSALSLLGATLEEALELVVKSLQHAVGARSVFLVRDGDDRVFLAGEPLDPAAQRRVRLSLASGAPVVGEARTHLGLTLAHDDRTHAWLGLVVDEPAQACHLLHDALRQLAGRLAAELTWRGLHDRVVTELDAQRASGGVDPDLGIWTPEAFRRLLRMNQSACRRSAGALSVGVLDVMGMTSINDRFGHLAGDAVLRHLARTTIHLLRDYDGVTRHQGDAIAILFDRCGPADAARALERVRAAVTKVVLDDGREIEVALAGGVSALGPAPDDVDQVLLRATAASHESAGRGGEIVMSDEHEVEARTSPSIYGLTLGGIYRLIHQVGVGGGGSVYRAEDLSLRRPVAVKILTPELATDETLLERFRDEASTLAALRHPNLVQVYAFGVDGDTAFFVMELVEGESVMHAIQRCVREGQRIPYARVVDIVRQTASALDALHGAGVIHRDVKPDNILLDPFRSRAVLADVGIARKRGGDVFLAGTPGYVAPEATRDPYVGRTADVYGLAVTAYEMLFLQLPWPVHDDPMVMVRHQSELPPTPPSELAPELAALDEVLLRGFHPDPRERWATAAELADALVQVLAHLDPKVASLARSDASVGVAPTMPIEAIPESTPTPPSLPSSRESVAHPLSRGVFFRTIARVVGVRETARWRAELAHRDPALGELLSAETAPLGWFSTTQLDALLTESPTDRAPEEIGQDLGRAVVRTSFRRFFPASPATLSPNGTLGVMGRIWHHYHRWGVLEVTADGKSAAVLRIEGSVGSTAICACVTGMLEALVQLSGGRQPRVEETSCQARGDEACSFAVRWS